MHLVAGAVVKSHVRTVMSSTETPLFEDIQRAFPNVANLDMTLRYHFTPSPQPFWRGLHELELNFTRLVRGTDLAWPDMASLHTLILRMELHRGSLLERSCFYGAIVNPALKASRGLRTLRVHQRFDWKQGACPDEAETAVLIETRHAELDLFAFPFDPVSPAFPRVRCKQLALGDTDLSVEHYPWAQRRPAAWLDTLAQARVDKLQLIGSCFKVMQEHEIQPPMGVRELVVLQAEVTKSEFWSLDFFALHLAPTLRVVDFGNLKLTAAQVGDLGYCGLEVMKAGIVTSSKDRCGTALFCQPRLRDLCLKQRSTARAQDLKLKESEMFFADLSSPEVIDMICRHACLERLTIECHDLVNLKVLAGPLIERLGSCFTLSCKTSYYLALIIARKQRNKTPRV